MLVDHDRAGDRKSLPGTFADLFGREERVVDLLDDFGRDAPAVVSDRDVNVLARDLRWSR